MTAALTVTGSHTRTEHSVRIVVDTTETFRPSWGGVYEYRVEVIRAAWQANGEGEGWTLVDVRVQGHQVRKDGTLGERSGKRDYYRTPFDGSSGSFDTNAPAWLPELVGRAAPSGVVRAGELT